MQRPDSPANHKRPTDGLAQRHYALLDSIDQGFCVLDVLFDGDTPVDFRILEVNAAFEGLTGLRDSVGRTMRELMPRHDRSSLAVYGRVIRTGRPERFVQQTRYLNGQWYDVYAFPVDGHIGVLFSDITERKRVERRQAYLLALGDALRPLTDPLAIRQEACRRLGEELGADRAYYCDVDESAGTVRISHDFTRAGVTSLVGRYTLSDFGWVGPAFRAGRPMVVGDVATTPLLRDADRPPLAALGTGAFVAVPLIKDGRLVALLCATTAASREWAAEVELVTETADRTWAAVERARGDAAVRASEGKYRTLFNSIDQGFCVIDVLFDEGTPVDYRFVDVNAAFEGQTGLTDAVGRSIREMVPTLEAHWFDMYGKVISTGQPVRFVSEARALGRWYDGYAFPIAGHVGVLFADITERKRMEVRLQEQEQLLTESAELAHVGGWSFDPVTLEGDWTAETARIHGLLPGDVASVPDGFGRFAPGDRERITAAVEDARLHGTPYDLELDFTAADGVKKRVRAICRPVVEDGKVVRVRGSLQDVTARHALEERLRQAQKMEAFGQLAGGVAHDFNNMLQVINGYAELLRRQLAADDPKAGLVDEISQAGERSATLTRQLLAFARKEVVAPKVLDLSAAAGDTTGMLRRLIGENIRLMTDLRPGVWPVLADPGQLEQVLINLAVNARDAMPDGGTLTVAARNETVVGDAEVRPGQYAVLSVTDTGTGMSPEVQARIFEPFFTTKEVGKGTGLGLASVYGIVQQAGGHVRVRSKVGEGSAFEVLLPRTKDPKADAAAKSAGQFPRGTETVLVVEDESAVRGLVRIVLSGCGYKVLVAADGVAAEKVAAEHAGPIHLVLSDVVMPGAGGRAAAAGVTSRHPGAKVIFMSGYTDDAIMHQGVSAAEVPFLQKPFTPASLAAKVRQVLDAPQ